MSLRFVEIQRFEGGCVDTEDLAIGKEALNMIRHGQNIRTRSGAVVPRDGSSTYCNFSAAAGVMNNDIQSMYEYAREKDGSYWRVIVFSLDTGKYYYVKPDDSTTVAVSVGSWTGTDFYAVNVFDHLFIGTGEDDLKVYDGLAVRNAGIAAPAAAPTVAYGGAVVAEYRKYKYTYYRSADPYDKESAASDEVTADLSGGRNVTVTMVASGDSQVTHYYLYCTNTYADPAAPETDFYLLTDQAIGVGNTFVDNYSDVSGAAAYDTTDRGYPPQVKYLLWHDNRLFGAGEAANPSVIYYSPAGKPFYFPASNWDEIARDDGDVITGLGAIGSTRFIFKTNSIYEWTGDPESVTPIRAVERRDDSMNMTRLAVGCSDPRSLCAWGNTLLFRAADGHVYMLDMDELVQLSRYYGTTVTSLNSGTRGVIHNDYYILTDGIQTVVCDLRRGMFGWEGADVMGDGVVPDCYLIDHNGYCLGALGDKIYRFYDTSQTDDNGSDFNRVFQTAYARIGRADVEGILRRVIAECSAFNVDFTTAVYSEDGLECTGALATTDRWWSIERGHRGNYMSARLTWTGSNTVEAVSLGHRPGRRH